MTPKKSAIGAGFFSIFTLTLSATALAAEPPPVEGSPEHVEARELFRKGNEAYRAGELEKARALYLDSIRKERTFDAVCNLGRSEADLNDDALALTHLDECLREYPPDAAVAGAREKFFHLRDSVRARCAEKNCQAKPAETPAVAPAPSETSKGEAAPESSSPAKEEARPSASEGSSWKMPVVLGTGALGLVGVGLGVGFTVSGNAAASDALALGSSSCLDSNSTRCEEYLAKVSESDEAHGIATGAFIAGGTLLGASLLTYFLWPESTSESARLRPAVAFDGRGFFGSLSGAF